MSGMACNKTPMSLCTTIALQGQTRIYLSMYYKTLPWLDINIIVVLFTDALQIMNELNCDRIFHLSVETESHLLNLMVKMSFHQASMNLMGWLVIRPPILQYTSANEDNLQCVYDRIQSRQG